MMTTTTKKSTSFRQPQCHSNQSDVNCDDINDGAADDDDNDDDDKSMA
jgi:hypothetical protein